MGIQVTPIPRLTTLTTPAFTLGTANAAGDALTAVASNSTLLAFDTTLPDAITFGQSGAVGSATVSSRRDHAHATPSVAAASGSAKAWCYSNQANPTTMLASYNMTSIADAGTGQTQYTLATDFSSANYVVQVSSNTDACHFSQNASLAAGVFDVICENFSGTGGDSEVAVACFGDQ